MLEYAHLHAYSFICLFGGLLACGVMANVAAAQNGPADSASAASVDEAVVRGQEAYAKQDYTTALRWFRAAADRGSPVGEIGVGMIYYKGYGVARNISEALRWFRKGSEHGSLPAQQMLCGLYVVNRHWIGPPDRRPKGTPWYGREEQGASERALG